ncbi:MAG TPA: cystathionine gamma-synthase [Acidimicrobiales bacterium]
MNFSTRAIHAGQEPDEATGAVNVPVYLTSTYAQESVGVVRFADYGRGDNPTRAALETVIASLEGAQFGVAFASGLAATDAMLRTLAPGDRVMLSADAYGGTFRMLTKIFGPWGIETDVVDLSDIDAVESSWREGTKLVWAETPSNPWLRIANIAALADISHRHDAQLVVDNTFATPYLQTPLALGADVVMHSTTKYLGGHSDAIGGILVTNDSALCTRLKFFQYAVGAIPGPLDCYLIMRGVRTLAVRMDRHQENAAQVVSMLSAHDQIERVWYPGLETHPNHKVALDQMRGFGGMVSVEIKGGAAHARAFVEKTKVFTLAESLGGVESLIELPAQMTHMSTSGSLLEIPENLVRLSVGIEDADDLLEDLAQALA